MSMSRCYTVMKCMLMLLNVVFLLVGISTCMLCGWVAVETGAGEDPARAGLVVVVVWAAALTMAALASLVGAARNSASLLVSAFALLALTCVAEAAAVWWGSAHVPALRAALTDRLTAAVQQDYGRQPPYTQLIDLIQERLDCCGVSGPRDWQMSAWSRERGGGGEGDTLDLSVLADSSHYWAPATCCSVPCGGPVRVAAAGGGGGVRAAGCGDLVLDALAGDVRVPLLAGAGLLAAHGLALVLALVLCVRAPHQRRYKA